jgi:prepilin-type N-terminal cleavage/methylation domain-containing protein
MRRGFSLVEVMIGVTILGVIGIPMIGVFIQSKNSISRTDVKREARYYIGEIMAHVERQSLHKLWDYFGPGEVVGFDTAGQLQHKLCEHDEKGRITGKNPLGFTPYFLQEMMADNLEARVYFEFYTRKELGVKPDRWSIFTKDEVNPIYGLHHMQAGWVQIYLLDRAKLKKSPTRPADCVVTSWKQPIMCPAIVGRPGLKLSGCPAVSQTVKLLYEPKLNRREARM